MPLDLIQKGFSAWSDFGYIGSISTPDEPTAKTLSVLFLALLLFDRPYFLLAYFRVGIRAY
jgi:hypothetical protein